MIMKMEVLDPIPGVRTHNKLPTRSPPRNDEGYIYCQHRDCEGKNVIFRRPCEYNKHMDRHERPYKCTNPACEQNPGFTYSGGLLRHQREVHKMHLSKQPLYCPHSNCMRSTGTGFTRKENLEEHVRRRHSASLDTQAAGGKASTLVPLTPNRKRPRQMSMDDDDGSSENARESQSAAAATAAANEHLIKKLRMEIGRQNQVLYQQAQELDRLRNLLQSLPPSLIYQPVTNMNGSI